MVTETDKTEVTVIVSWNPSQIVKCNPTDDISGAPNEIDDLIEDLKQKYRKKGCVWQGEPVKELRRTR